MCAGARVLLMCTSDVYVSSAVPRGGKHERAVIVCGGASHIPRPPRPRPLLGTSYTASQVRSGLVWFGLALVG